MYPSYIITLCTNVNPICTIYNILLCVLQYKIILYNTTRNISGPACPIHGYYKNNIETLVMYNDGPIQNTTITITLLLLLLYSLLYSYIARIILYSRGAALSILRERNPPLQHPVSQFSYG